MKEEKIIKRTINDSVFSDLFTNEKYLLELYKILLEDKAKSGISEKDIEILNIDKTFINDLYNDLCFTVDNELILLLEAQSTYTKNIVTRLFLYLARDIEKYLRSTSVDGKLNNLYKSKEVKLPKVKLYTVYTGNTVMEDHYIDITELMYDDDVESDLNLKVKVICKPDKDNVLGQYMLFCKTLSEQKKIYGNTKKAVELTIEICKQKDVLKEYLEKRKYEVLDMISQFITTEDWVEHRYNEGISIGRNEGISIGEKRGISIGQVRGMLMADVPNYKISELTGASEEEILEIKNNM